MGFIYRSDHPIRPPSINLYNYRWGNTHMYTHMYTHTYTHMHTHIHTHAHKHTHTHTHLLDNLLAVCAKNKQSKQPH